MKNDRSNCVIAKLLACLLAVFIGGGASLGSAFAQGTGSAAWFSPSWAHRKQVTIHHSRVSGSADLAGFPVLVSGIDAELKTSANGGGVGNNSGWDFVFTTADGTTQLPHEIEKYVGATGELVAWVKVPTLSVSADTALYVYYGNSNLSSSRENAAAVWDANYRGVWHLSDASWLSYRDSTGNGNNGTTARSDTAPALVAGQIGGGQSFNASANNYISAGASATVLQLNNVMTLEAWINTNASGRQTILSYDNQASTVQFEVNGSALGVMAEGLGWIASTASGVIQPNQAYHVVYTRNGAGANNHKLYINGVSQTLSTNNATDFVNATNALVFGRRFAVSQQFSGLLDEIRISGIARTADWISTEYNNQSGPSTFCSLDSAETQQVISVSVTPGSQTLYAWRQQQFSAAVAGSTSGATTAVTWSIDPQIGSITPGGLYRAPSSIAAQQPVTVTATSSIDPSKSGTATITLMPPPSAGGAWFNSSWSHRRQITLYHARVSGTTDLTGFPVLISGIDSGLKSVANGGGVANDSGWDFIFTGADGTTQLPHQIEKYISTTGEFVAWVKVPALSVSNDTVLYLYYGNAFVPASQENRAGVWDSSYRGVWHLSETSGLSYGDSTAYGNTGTTVRADTAPTPVAGQIGGGQSFNASARNYISAGSNASVLQLGNVMTLEAWIRTTSTDRQTILSHDNQSSTVQFEINGITAGGLGVIVDGTNVAYNGTGVIQPNQAYHVVYTRSGTGANNHELYVNGVAQSLLINSSTDFVDPTNALVFGRRAAGGQQFSGLLDELRVSSAARSAEWIATEYNNQSSPSTFYAMSGAEGAAKQTSSVTLATSPNPSILGQAVTLTATVSPSSATGTVQFFDGTTALGTTTISAGQALLNVANLSMGTHSITASYSGDSSYNASTSTEITQAVLRPPSSVALTSSVNPSAPGQSVVFTATVSPAAATGTVQFLDGTTTVLGSVNVSAGQATFTTSTLTTGTHPITAMYSGDSAYDVGASAPLVQVVGGNSGRSQHSATLLPNGKILVAGGVSCPTAGSCSYLSSAEIYDPAADTSVSTGGMTTARSAPAVLLPSGKVLVAGGYSCDASGNCSSLNSVELYDAAAGTFSSAGNMLQARSGHTLTPLGDGTVLIAGGQVCASAASCSALSSAEIYNPATGTFTATSNSMSAARFGAAAAKLNSGLVVIAGGANGTNLPAAAEIYDPSARTFASAGPSLQLARLGATATLLNSGKVLFAGGSTCVSPGCPTTAAEVYDPAANTFSTVASGMAIARFRHTATLLTNGQVVMAGGVSSCGASCVSEASTEVFDPVAGTFSSGQTLGTAVSDHTGILVANGNVVLLDGISGGVTLAGGQWIQPTSMTPAGLTSITVTPASAFLTAGDSQKLTATGTFSDGSTQTLQSVVWSSSNAEVATVSGNGTVNAVGAGTATVTATAGAVHGSASVSVVTIVALAIQPVNRVVTAGTQQQFTATATLSNGSTRDATASATWSSSNPAIAAVANAAPTKGLVTAAAAGVAQIAAAVGNVQATTSVIVPVSADVRAPSVTSVTPGDEAPGHNVTITGTNFGEVQGTGKVLLGSSYGTVVSWSPNAIVATVGAHATSGSVQVQQGGVWSNVVDFTVDRAIITGAASARVGTQIVATITGTNFGAAQGSGQVWLGTAPGVVQSWSDTQIVAAVASGSGSGKAQVLQGGVWSNAIPFEVNVLRITKVEPEAGAVGQAVTITGSGFGTAPGSGVVWLGSTAGEVVSWTDTQVVANVASGSVTGVARIQQGGAWSNAVTFTVTVSGTDAITLSPNRLTMLVGETRTLQALNSAKQAASGLTWATSDANIVSLSTDDPPVLTAVAAGRAIITAGNASTEVTVTSGDPAIPGVLPVGTVLWSVPGPVFKILPAVPSPKGVADVFAIQSGGMVQAITSDGKVAWTASLDADVEIETFKIMGDFDGGLVYEARDRSIIRLDGATGASTTLYSSASLGAIHPDGTVFAVEDSNDLRKATVVGLSLTGGVKFRVQLTAPEDGYMMLGDPIVAGDGYAYFPYQIVENHPEWTQDTRDRIQIQMVRVSTDGAYTIIPIVDSGSRFYCCAQGMVRGFINNQDKGVFMTWSFAGPTRWQGDNSEGASGTATISGSSASVSLGGDEIGEMFVQGEDGTLFATGPNGMVAFDDSGSVRWTTGGTYTPKIAIAGGGVIATDDSGAAYIFDKDGAAVGQMESLPTYSWLGNGYKTGSVIGLIVEALYIADARGATAKGSDSDNYVAAHMPWFPPLKRHKDKNLRPAIGYPGQGDLLDNALADLVQRLSHIQSGSICDNAIKSLLARFSDSNGFPITTEHFLEYIQYRPMFLDANASHLPHMYATCGERKIAKPDCQGNGLDISQVIDDPRAEPTVITVGPSYPFKSFWWTGEFQPSTHFSDSKDFGFGRGIDPASDGANVNNVSNLLHEYLHGITGLNDWGISAKLPGTNGDNTLTISKYVRDNVISTCPAN